MMREEFNAILDRLNEGWVTDLQVPYPTDDEYKIIETVYAWYPDQCGRFDKEACVKLYFDFGMIIFYDIERRANRMLELDNEIRMKQVARDKLRVERMA